MTAAVTRCDCCDLPVDSCGLAAERRQHAADAMERARLLQTPGAFPAQFVGTCARCGERFRPGDPIVRDTSPGAWSDWRSLMCCEGA